MAAVSTQVGGVSVKSNDPENVTGGKSQPPETSKRVLAEAATLEATTKSPQLAIARSFAFIPWHPQKRFRCYLKALSKGPGSESMPPDRKKYLFARVQTGGPNGDLAVIPSRLFAHPV
jgi:hypothetical protein